MYLRFVMRVKSRGFSGCRGEKVEEIKGESQVLCLGFKMVPFTEIRSKGERRVVFITRTSVYIIKSELAYIIT